MKAITIGDFPIAREMGVFCPEIEETVEIIGDVVHPYFGLYYFLEKGPSDWGYDADKFVPCQEMEEEVMIIEKEEVF